jgi:hypothetical protein
MGYVVYTSHVSVQERKRTPLGKFTSWFHRRLAGTFIQKYFSFIIRGSLITRYATAIALGLLLGVLFDFSIHLYLPTTSGNPIACAILGAIAGLGACGGFGVPIGALWGWLIGGITDTIASELISDPVSNIPSKIIAWCTTCLIGWWIGLFAEWCFNKMSAKSKRWRKFIIRLFILVSFVSIAIFLYHLVFWGFINYPILTFIARIFKVSWRLSLVIICWLIVIGMISVSLLSWWSDKAMHDLRNFQSRYGIDRSPYDKYGTPQRDELSNYYYHKKYCEYVTDNYSWPTITLWAFLLLFSIFVTVFLFI